MNSSSNIDILLAAYNGQTYLSEQIDSILAQSNRNWRLIIRDDGSQDNTQAVLREYRSRFPEKIILFEDEDHSLGTKMNFQRLIQYSTAKYIMLSDQDDVWLPEKVEKTFQVMKNAEKEYPNQPILVHTDLRVVDSDLKTVAASMWKYQRIFPETGNDVEKVAIQNVATGSTIMINKKAKEVSLPIPEQAVMHDWWIAIKVAEHGKIAYIPEQLVLYRQHNKNAVGAKKITITSVIKSARFQSGLIERLRNYYRMEKHRNPRARFWSVLLKRIYFKIVQACK